MTRQKLTAIIGPMFSSKTTLLLDLYDKERKERKLDLKSPYLYKPSIDSRFGTYVVGTHNGRMRQAILCETSSSLYAHIVATQGTGVYIDEAEFFDDRIVETIDDILERVPVTFAALNQDYTGAPFRFRDSTRHIGELIAMADQIYLRQAICEICKQPASKTQRLIHSKDLVVVGGAGDYSARCVSCHEPHLGGN